MSADPHDAPATARLRSSPEAYASTLAEASIPPDVESHVAGRRVGPYRVVREVGHGGMGSVYLAVRDDDQYRKQVALKLLRGLGSREAVARFLDERQILASLEHPGIVRMLDGGSTEDGLPFLVMEHVQGLAITEYSERNGLSVRDRVELFRRVCAAVQFAHQRLIVHRDLKPRNILVSSDGMPKLLDFGIAKLLGDGPREAQTRTGVHILTPEYGAPEQARGEAITVATDVYSLGAVLYEVLTGTRAHRFPSESMVVMMQTICELDPPRPSEVAPVGRRRALAGDLDNIVLKALHKQPGRRYQTVEQLSEDLRRYLVGLPVAARAGTWGYRIGKLVRRHRGALAAALLLFTTLTTATVYSLRQARRADQQAQLARRHFNDVHELASSLLFEVDGKIRNLAGATAARELIVSRALGYLDILAVETGRDPALSLELARGYVKIGGMQSHVRLPSLGRPREARQSYEKALQILTELRASGHDDAPTRWALAEVLFDMGYMYRWEGQHAQARQTLVEGMKLIAAADHAKDFNYPVAALGLFTMWAIDKEARALPAMVDTSRAMLALATEWTRKESTSEARYWLGMANEFRGLTLELSGDPDAAGTAYQVAIALFETIVADPADAGWYRSDLAYVYWGLGRTLGGRGDPELWLPDQGQSLAAEASLRKSLAIAEGLVAKDDNDARTTVRVAATLANLATVVAMRDTSEAMALYDRSQAIYDGLPAGVRDWSYTRKAEWFLACSRAELLARAGRRDDALASLARGRALVEPFAGASGASFRDRGALLLCKSREALTREALGDRAQAELLAAGVADGLRALIAEQRETITPYLGLVETLEQQARLRPDRRCELLGEAVTVWRSYPGARTAYLRRRLSQLERAAGDCSPRPTE